MVQFEEATNAEYKKKAKIADAACKRLLSQRNVLAQILKACVFELKDVDVAEIEKTCIQDIACQEPLDKIIGLRNEDNGQDEQTIFYDIRFMVKVPKEKEPVELMINVEAQGNAYPGYPLIMRGLYYGCRLVGGQYGTLFDHSNYHKIKKVYSIWILMHPPKLRENTIAFYELRERNYAGVVKEKRQYYDIVSVVMIGLAKDNKDAQGIIRLLGILLSNEIVTSEKAEILENEFSLHMNEWMKEVNTTMCNYSDSIWEKGIERGREEGRRKGREEGVAERTRDIAKRMLQMKFTIEEIMKACGLTMDEVKKLQAS